MSEYGMPEPRYVDDKPPAADETPIVRHAEIDQAASINLTHELERQKAIASLLGARVSLQALTLKWLLSAASANVHFASVAMAVCDHLDLPALDSELRQLHDRALTLTNNIRQIYGASLFSATLPSPDGIKGRSHDDR